MTLTTQLTSSLHRLQTSIPATFHLNMSCAMQAETQTHNMIIIPSAYAL